jgi:hypothetical protein
MPVDRPTDPNDLPVGSAAPRKAAAPRGLSVRCSSGSRQLPELVGHLRDDASTDGGAGFLADQLRTNFLRANYLRSLSSRHDPRDSCSGAKHPGAYPAAFFLQLIGTCVWASRLRAIRVLHTAGTSEGATRPALPSPLPLAILAIGRSPEVEDSNAQAEVEKGVLGSKLRRRDLASPKAVLILFASSLLLGGSLCEGLHLAGHGGQFPPTPYRLSFLSVKRDKGRTRTDRAHSASLIAAISWL